MLTTEYLFLLYLTFSIDRKILCEKKRFGNKSFECDVYFKNICEMVIFL